MNSNIAYFGLLLLSILSNVNCAADTKAVQSVSRDGYGRADPNLLLNGFFPAWAIILLCLSGLFLVIAIISFIGFKLGCRNPKKFNKLSS